MKKIIFASTVLLAFLISPAIAQKVNGYNANAYAKAMNIGKGHVAITNIHAIPVSGVGAVDPKCACDIPERKIAKYISPLGFLLKDSHGISDKTILNKLEISKNRKYMILW